MFSRRRTGTILLICVLLILIITFLSPPERSLGSNVRLAYLHGAWVWTALIGFVAAGILGIVGLYSRRKSTQRWSISIGQAATIFWFTYLPLSLLTMQQNWNGLFLDEPRWRVGLDFALIASLFQFAILLFKDERLGSALNIFFILALSWSLAQTEQVMHPPSPILNSDAQLIRLFFIALLGLCLLSGYMLTNLLHTLQTES